VDIGFSDSEAIVIALASIMVSVPSFIVAFMGASDRDRATDLAWAYLPSCFDPTSFMAFNIANTLVAFTFLLCSLACHLYLLYFHLSFIPFHLCILP